MLPVNKQAIAAAFGRAARSYSQHDELQRQSAQGLMTLLGERRFTQVLDAGCGPGGNSRLWREAGSHVTAIDLSPAMLDEARQQQAAHRYLVADIEAIPLADAQFDLVWSHLAVQWCSSLPQALSELYRVACPGGKVAFTTLLESSLPELNQAWQAVDEQPHANRFLSYEQVMQALAGWLSQYGADHHSRFYRCFKRDALAEGHWRHASACRAREKTADPGPAAAP